METNDNNIFDTPEQRRQAYIEKSRVESDTELIREGARIVFDTKTNRQVLILLENQIKNIHLDMYWKDYHEKEEIKKDERIKEIRNKIRPLDLQKNQVIIVSFKKNSCLAEYNVRFYFSGISGNKLIVERVDYEEDCWDKSIGETLNFEIIIDIKIGNKDDIAYAEEMKKEYGPFKDGSRIIYRETSPSCGPGEGSEGFSAILNSKREIVLDRKENRRDFNKVEKDLISGLTLEECWYKPKREAESKKIGEEFCKIYQDMISKI